MTDQTFAEHEGARLARRCVTGRDRDLGGWRDAGYRTPEDAARALLGDDQDGTGAYDVAVRLVAAALRGEAGAR